jgi:hypothetical protein
LRSIRQKGFAVIPGALDTAQIAVANRVIDADIRSNSQAWAKFDETLLQCVDMLSRTGELDFTIENPATLGPLRMLLGEEIAFEEFTMVIREPTVKTSDIKGFHRDLIRDYNRRMEIQYISVIYYLTDISENDHCFSIVPETHNRLVDMKPEEVKAGDEVDITGRAGTAIIFHGRCIHAGKLKPHSRQRRTLHLYYWLANRPRTTEWTTIPSRLYEKVDASLHPLLYSKWNIAESIDGVGRKPRDLDPSMPVAEMLIEVQRRANKKA